MWKCISYQDYPSFDLHHSLLYVYGFCIKYIRVHKYIFTTLYFVVHVHRCRNVVINLFNLNVNIHTLHTVLHTYLVLLIRRICLIIKIFFTGLPIPFFKTFMYNFIKCWLHLKELTIKKKLKSITLRYIKVIWFLFICRSNGGVLLYIKRK